MRKFWKQSFGSAGSWIIHRTCKNCLEYFSAVPNDILVQMGFLNGFPIIIRHRSIRIVGSGVQMGPLGTSATEWPIVPAPGDYDGEFGGMKIGRGNRSTRRKCAPAPLCLPEIPLDQTRAPTQAAVVGSQRLTAWAMGRPNTGVCSVWRIIFDVLSLQVCQGSSCMKQWNKRNLPIRWDFNSCTPKRSILIEVYREMWISNIF
jgi:hypothetical protein